MLKARQQIAAQINSSKKRLQSLILYGAIGSLRSRSLRDCDAAEAPETLADPQAPRRVDSTCSAQAFAETNTALPAQNSKQRSNDGYEIETFKQRNERW